MATFTLADTEKNAMLDTLDSKFVSLHTGDPSTTGANECTGGSYVRQAENLGPAANGSKTNTASLEFAGMPAANVSHVGFWTANASGTFLGGGALANTVTVPVGATFRFQASNLTCLIS